MRLKAHLLIFSSAHCPSDGHYPSPQFLPRCSHRDAFVEQDSSVEPLLLDLPGCPSAAAAPRQHTNSSWQGGFLQARHSLDQGLGLIVAAWVGNNLIPGVAFHIQ